MLNYISSSWRGRLSILVHPQGQESDAKGVPWGGKRQSGYVCIGGES